MLVADYIVAQLNLLGAMCLDRNYISMALIEKEYPYDNLVSMIRSDV